MNPSILFRVRPDGPSARWMNLARAVGLLGALLYALATYLETSQQMGTVAQIVRVPAILLGLGNLVWVYMVPSLVLLICYAAAAAVICCLNLLHIIVLQKSNDELIYFLVKFMNMRSRAAISVLGLTDKVPHVDLYASAPDEKLMGLRFRHEEEMPMRLVLLRLAILVVVSLLFYLLGKGLAYIPYGVMAVGILGGLIAAVFALSVLVVWVHNAITGKHLRLFVDLQLRLMRVGLSIESYFSFVTNDWNEFRSCFRSALEEAPPSGGDGAWLNPNEPRRLDINLIALVVLIAGTSGLYLLIWLARTAKVMGDDPFTIVAVTFVGSLLPLSVIFSRYYRRLEKKTGNEPSWVLELLMVIPGINLLVGTFTIQYILNLSKRARAA